MAQHQFVGLVSVMASIILVTGLAGPAEAEVKSVAPNGFEVVDTATIQAPPERVYSALGQISQWWSSARYRRGGVGYPIIEACRARSRVYDDCREIPGEPRR